MNVSILALFIFAFVARETLSRDLHVRDTQCYGDLGCFESHEHVPVPASPQHIATQFKLHIRGTSHVYTLAALGFKSGIGSWASHFDISKKTKFIIHGYMNSGNQAWISTMTTELLKKDDFNVVVVDWGHGAAATYDKAAANTYVVGAEVAQFIQYLHDNQGLSYSDVHLIGHSLGAQICGHVGRQVRTLARISGLDPADPLFSGTSNDRHLDSSDASFVDVIHTDGSKFKVVSGYGTHDPVGDIDFYPNGGQDQPGCEEHPAAAAINNLANLHLGSVTSSITCSHQRSVALYTESINSKCHFYGHTCPTADNYEAGSCLGCPSGGCPMMGYDADTTDQQGTFYLSTSGSSPYCGREYFVDIKVSQLMLHTYGEFMITLVGTRGQSEPLKFESAMHDYNHGADERHVISTHNDVGTVTSVQLQFVKAKDSHGFLAMPYIKVHSIRVVAAETSHSVKFCAHEHHFNSGETNAVTSTRGC